MANNSAIIYSVCIMTILLRIGFVVAGIAGYLICVDALSAGLSSRDVSLGSRWELFYFFNRFVIWSTVYTITVLAIFVWLSIALNKDSASLSNTQNCLRIIIHCTKMSIDYAKAYICLIIDGTLWCVWLLRIMGVKVEDVSSVMHYMSRVHNGGVVKKGAVLDNTRCINHALIGRRLIFGHEPVAIGKNCVLGPGSMAVMTNVPERTICDVRSVTIGDFSNGEGRNTLCFVSGSPIAPIAVWSKNDEESESAARHMTTNGHGNIDEMTPNKQHAISNGVQHITTTVNIIRKRNGLELCLCSSRVVSHKNSIRGTTTIFCLYSIEHSRYVYFLHRFLLRIGGVTFFLQCFRHITKWLVQAVIDFFRSFIMSEIPLYKTSTKEIL